MNRYQAVPAAVLVYWLAIVTYKVVGGEWTWLRGLLSPGTVVLVPAMAAWIWLARRKKARNHPGGRRGLL